jgi:hypothetical protein
VKKSDPEVEEYINNLRAYLAWKSVLEVLGFTTQKGLNKGYIYDIRRTDFSQTKQIFMDR